MDRKTVVLAFLILLCIVGMVFAHIKFDAQEKRVKELTTAIQELNGRLAERQPAAQPIVQKEAYDDSLLLGRIRDLEDALKKLSQRSAAPVAETPAAVAQQPADPTQIEQIVKDVMKKREVERSADRERGESVRYRAGGLTLISSAVKDLSEQQKEAIAPLMIEYAQAVRPLWWPGIDENGNRLTFDEQVRRSDEIRARIYGEVKKNLSSGQSQQFDQWILERKAKIEKGDRTEGEGPFQWF